MSSFHANYRRFTPDTTRLVQRISEALGVIRGARVLPAVADQLRASALAGTVHYSNVIEGNELPFVEAERAARGDLAPDSRAKVELIDYVAALDLIDERLADGNLTLDSAFAKELHGIAMKGLGREDDEHFKPHHEGDWRDGIALVVDKLTGRVMHEGPHEDDVPGLMDEVFAWHARKRADDVEPPYVLAGVLHYWVTEIHPFADGNGRSARLLQTASLMQSGVLPGRMFSFERYYADDRSAYYGALRSVREHNRNLEAWLAYYLTGLAQEYERVAETVTDLASLLGAGGSAPLRLTAGQERALASLRISGRREFTRRDYEDAAGVARTAAHTELRQLVAHGLLLTKGRGPTTSYTFASTVGSGAERSGPGRPPTWNDDKIERALREYLRGHDGWPTRQQFTADGRSDLYSAAARNGGIKRWRRLLGH